jgi:uncharacterized protein (DUF1800 family)
MGSSTPASEVRRATFLRAVYSKRQLVEVLADHWHNHFNVYAWDYPQAAVFVHYDRDVIRKHLFGNFRVLVEAAAKSPAMLYYLDNQTSSGDRPNENFSRELHEIHVMGAENYYGVRPLDDPAIFDDQGNRKGYIDEDVYGATTCFTGWRFNEEAAQFEFDTNRHFPYQKFHMGKVLPSFQGIQDGLDVLDTICSHPGAARYICRRLCRRLVSDNPPESLVQAAADVFITHRNRDDQLRRVVRTILLSTEFRATWGEKVKRPFEFVASLLRAANADFEPTDSFLWEYGQTGQGLFEWRPPDGYPDTKEAWSSTMPMLQRWRRVNSLVRWTYGGDGANQNKARLDFYSQMPKNRKTPVEIANFWIQRILGRAMPDAERQTVVDFMAHGRNPEFELPADQIVERLPHMVSLIFLSPSFHWR